jgi:hypothetical protein
MFSSSVFSILVSIIMLLSSLSNIIITAAMAKNAFHFSQVFSGWQPCHVVASPRIFY